MFGEEHQLLWIIQNLQVSLPDYDYLPIYFQALDLDGLFYGNDNMQHHGESDAETSARSCKIKLETLCLCFLIFIK